MPATKEGEMKFWQFSKFAALGLAGLSFILSVISRVALGPIFTVTPSAFLRFADTCLLFALSFGMFQFLSKGEDKSMGSGC